MVYKYGKKLKRSTWHKPVLYSVVGLLIGIITGVGSVLRFDLQLPMGAHEAVTSVVRTLYPSYNNKSSAAAGIDKNELQAKTTVLLCGPQMNQYLPTAKNPYLRRLAEYDAMCPGAVSGSSFFVETPRDSTEGKEMASWLGALLEEYAHAGIHPIIFMEPMHDGEPLDAHAYADGVYDPGLDTLFSHLKSRQISDEQLGTWVFWPEGNIPVWSSLDPATYVQNVTRSAQIQKQYFPKSKVALLLDSKSYPQSGSWENGKYVSFLPYLQTIPKGLFDSFGMQGFAWPPTEQGDTSQLDAAQFLPADLVIEAADFLEIKDVWVNTGVFYRSYIIDSHNPVELDETQRVDVLRGIANQMQIMKNAGLNVGVHLFAEDKSARVEKIDWSYWHAIKVEHGHGTKVFRNAIALFQGLASGIWVYDTEAR